MTKKTVGIILGLLVFLILFVGVLYPRYQISEMQSMYAHAEDITFFYSDMIEKGYDEEYIVLWVTQTQLFQYDHSQTFYNGPILEVDSGWTEIGEGIFVTKKTEALPEILWYGESLVFDEKLGRYDFLLEFHMDGYAWIYAIASTDVYSHAKIDFCIPEITEFDACP